MRRTLIAFTALAAAAVSTSSHAAWIPTNTGNGADAEVRESSPTTNRGSSTELASRVKNDSTKGDANDGSDRNSAIYVRIDLTDHVLPADGHTAFRMTYRNNNLNGSRIQDTVTPNPQIRTGLAIYGLNNKALGNWNETETSPGAGDGITYATAPGITFDGDVGTKDFNSDLMLLGTVAFPEIGNQSWLPVGGSLIFADDALDSFVGNAISAGETSVTLVATVIHGGDTPFSNWINFNYLFNPKEQTTLNDDPNYDSDTTDPNNPVGSPWSGADNSAGDFSPALLLRVPEPGTISLGLFAVAGLAVSRRRHNRRGVAGVVPRRDRLRGNLRRTSGPR